MAGRRCVLDDAKTIQQFLGTLQVNSGIGIFVSLRLFQPDNFSDIAKITRKRLFPQVYRLGKPEETP